MKVLDSWSVRSRNAVGLVLELDGVSHPEVGQYLQLADGRLFEIFAVEEPRRQEWAGVLVADDRPPLAGSEVTLLSSADGQQLRPKPQG